jgi:hypothetical protein
MDLRSKNIRKIWLEILKYVNYNRTFEFCVFLLVIFPRSYTDLLFALNWLSVKNPNFETTTKLR